MLSFFTDLCAFLVCCIGAFFTKSQAILNMEMFLIVTTGFIYYGRKAYVELRYVTINMCCIPPSVLETILN